MNERIRELVEQAVKDVDIVTGNELLDDELTKMYIPDCFAEKFAELIVRECINIAQDRANFPGFPPNDVNDIIDEIKEHFGVEE
jgi:hypothetical protein